MVSTIEELDEMRGQSLYYWDRMDRSNNKDWMGETNAERESYIEISRRIREADERIGLVTVPKEPGLAAEMLGDALMREHIRDELTDSAAIYQIMVNASPFAKDGGDK